MVCRSQALKIDELAALVHPRVGHRKIFAMIEAYLDESGIHEGAAICVIAGYFGGKSQMRKLEKAWKKVLADFHFPLEKFHAKNLIKSNKHHPMLGALAQAIAGQAKAHPVSYGIIVDDFNSFSLAQRRFLTGATISPKSKKLLSTGCPSKAYFVPFQGVVRLITDYAPVGGKAHFNFGIDRPFAEYAVKLFKQIQEQATTGLHPWSTWKSMDRLGTPLFPKASETAQLQAADLLVHLTYLHMCEWRNTGKVEQPSGLLMECLTNRRSDGDFLYKDKECLEKLLSKSREYVDGWDTLPATSSTVAEL